MPLVDWLREKWLLREQDLSRLYREQESIIIQARRFREREKESRRFRACQEIAYWLKESDKSSEHSDYYYQLEAQKRISGFRWQLHRFNKPFIWLEKQIIEPLDFWSDRANVFQFFAKISPLIQAIGVLAIPFVLFIYEGRREERQIAFEQNVISSQTVRGYVSEINNTYLELKIGNPNKSVREQIKDDKELQKFLEATTLAIFNELSVNKDFQDKSNNNYKFNEKAIESDRKSKIIDFLSKLRWISGKKPLLSLKKANLSQAKLSRAYLNKAKLMEADLRETDLRFANLMEADLRGADLRGANLSGATLRFADLRFTKLREAKLTETKLIVANLRGANLRGADLRGADLRGADLRRANLRRTILVGANLRGANLMEADLISARNLTPKQIKSACFWETAIYKGNERENTKYIEELKKDKSSDPKELPDCSRWD